MRAMSSAESQPTRSGLRINGLVFVILLVAVGFGATAVLYRWRASQLGDDFRRTRDEMPADPSARLELWTEYGRVLIDQRVVQLRYSSDRPWLLTHTVARERNSAEQEIWGVDLSGISTASTHREGLEVIYSLPRPRVLGHGAIGGDKAMHVPHVTPDGEPIDAEERARSMIAWALQKLTSQLAKDIPGATFTVRFDAEPAHGG